MPGEDVRLLAEFARNGDEGSFAQIVRKYETLVWNICCRILHNRCDAEDAFQSTFMLLATRARRIRKPKSLSSWLYGVAFRTASTIRRQRQRDMLPLESVADHRLGDDILERVAQKNENELVSAEILLMKEKLRTPLLMFYFMGDSVPDIAATLGVSVSTVEGRLRQARRMLKMRLTVQGVGFDQYCPALLLPCMAMSPSLASTTINNVMVASTSKALTGGLSGTTVFSQIGAKIMMTKLAATCGLFMLVTVGVLHPVAMQEGETTHVVAQQQEAVEVQIKLADEDSEEEVIVVGRNLHQSIHDHLMGLYRWAVGEPAEEFEFADHEYRARVIFDHPEAAGEETGRYELRLADPAEIQFNNLTVDLSLSNELGAEVENWNQEIQLNVPTHIGYEIDPSTTVNGASLTIDRSLQSIDDVEATTHFVIRVPKTETRDLPYLSKLPLIGRLFKNVGVVEDELLVEGVEIEEIEDDQP